MTLKDPSEPDSIIAGDPLPGISSYFHGPDEKDWFRAVPHFANVRLTSIFPGIDLVYYAKGSQLEYDFHVAPGAAADRIAFTLQGATTIRLVHGDLVMTTPAGEIRQLRPVAWQTEAGKRIPVNASFILSGNEVRFRLGSYRKDLPLTIDPAIQWTSGMPRVPGAWGASAEAIAVGSDGATYLTGTAYLGSGVGSAFVFKINPTGTALSYLGHSVMPIPSPSPSTAKAWHTSVATPEPPSPQRTPCGPFPHSPPSPISELKHSWPRSTPPAAISCTRHSSAGRWMNAS
ncbi:MAG: hypothetical protein HY820_19585 [Acidobacteria bacterium]|nr:hypothetical protein [Acidobacteriota bacterium]